MRKALYATVGVLLAASLLKAQTRNPAQADDTGRELFQLYCASCHGVEGRGNGPAADSFWVRPKDLTQFAKRNGGVFNDALIYRVVDGGSIKSHGNSEMPVWGDAFRRRLGLDEEGVKQRIEAIVRYIGSIQERAGH